MCTSKYIFNSHVERVAVLVAAASTGRPGHRHQPPISSPSPSSRSPSRGCIGQQCLFVRATASASATATAPKEVVVVVVRGPRDFLVVPVSGSYFFVVQVF